MHLGSDSKSIKISFRRVKKTTECSDFKPRDPRDAQPLMLKGLGGLEGRSPLIYYCRGQERGDGDFCDVIGDFSDVSVEFGGV